MIEGRPMRRVRSGLEWIEFKGLAGDPMGQTGDLMVPEDLSQPPKDGHGILYSVRG